MFTIQKFTTKDEELAKIAFAIRQKVFVEEQKVSREEEYDEFEEEANHYLISIDGEPAGTCRWRFTAKGIKLERFAVLPQFRGNGTGSFLVKHVLSEVKPLNKLIYLHAQVAAMNLYLRAGFNAEGQLFYEANIPHYRMTYSN
ncbi:GNAT family N-acetyltransferase [soil metagenome]